MMKENLGLLCCRQQNKVGFHHALISDSIVESCIVSDKTREISYIFPLYIYPDKCLYNGGSKYEREVNIEKAIYESLEKSYGNKLKPEQIMFYVYAVLYSNTYRQKYAEFLKSDFPRIPFTADYVLFSKMSKLGGEIVDLHLMRSKKLDKPTAKFEGKGDNLVSEIKYDPKEELVYINLGRHFGPVSKDVWEYQIGGYQIMAKWLKDRKNCRLVLDDIKHYCRMATAIKETIELQKKIDIMYRDVEKKCVNIEICKRVS
jgi:predicted helicase